MAEGRTVDLPALSVRLLVGDERDQAVALDYWAHTVDENGKLTWTNGVQESHAAHRPEDRARHGDPRTHNLLESICVVTAKFVVCPVCGQNLPICSRARIRSGMAVTTRMEICSGCTAQQVAKQKAEFVAAHKREYDAETEACAAALLARAARRPVITAEGILFELPRLTLRIFTKDINAQQDAIDYWDHDLDEGKVTWVHRVKDVAHRDGQRRSTMGLIALVQATCVATDRFCFCSKCGEPHQPQARAGIAVSTVSTPLDYVCSPCGLVQQAQRAAEAEVALSAATLAKEAAKTAKAAARRAQTATARAVPPGPKRDQLVYAGPGKFTQVTVRELFARPRDSAWADDALMLTRLAITYEAGRYYDYRVATGDRSLGNQDREGRVKVMMFEHAKRASIGQCYALLWLLTKEDEATAQARAASRGSSMDFTCRRIQGLMRKDQFGTLTTKNYARVFGLDFSGATEDLFRGLFLDPLTATPLEIAGAIKDQLKPEVWALRSIVRGVSEDEFSRAWGITDGLAFMIYEKTKEGLELSENAFAFFEVLHSGFVKVCGTAINAGCADADAFRSAYFGCLASVGFPLEIRYEVQRFVRESVAGTTSVDAKFAEVTTDGWPGAPLTPQPTSPTSTRPALTVVR